MTKRSRQRCNPQAAELHADAVVLHNAEEGERDEKPVFFTHLDLFVPLLKYYTSFSVSTSEVVGHENENDNGDVKPTNHTVMNGDLTTVVTSQSQQQQLNMPASQHYREGVMRSFVFPGAVSTYLSRVRLLPIDATDDNESRKKLRVEFPSNDKLNLDDMLANIRTFAEARLPAFADDSEFIAAHEARYVWKEWAVFSSGIFNGNGHLYRVLAMSKLDIFRQCRPCQQAAVELYTSHISTRLQKMPLAPRVVRVAQKLKLLPHELATLTYMLVCHCGSAWPLNSGSSAITPAGIAFHNDLNAFQLMHFLADYREHMKQGVITSDVKCKSSFMDSRLTISQEVIAALSGDSLSEEQLIKLEKTALAEILMAERSDVATTLILDGDGNDKTKTSSHNNNENANEASNSDGSSNTSGESTPNIEALGVDSALLQIAEGDTIESAVVDRLHTLLPNIRVQLLSNNAVSGCNGSVASSTSHAATGSNIYAPYTCDIEYMDESFKLLANVVRLRGAESDMKDEDEAMFTPKNKLEATIRELRGKVRVATAIHCARTEATLKGGKFIPRIEALSQRLKLSELEKRIMLLLVGNVVSHDILIAINGRYVMREGQRVLTVGYILFVLCDTLKERVAARRSFYQSGALLSNSILSLSLDSSGRTCFNTDLMDYIVDIDRKIVDYLMGTETETAEMVPGSRLYIPAVPMENVILPTSTTEMVLTKIKHYSLFEQCKRSCGFGEGLGTSTNGLVFLFYGPSGTGKTMLANAVAYELNKRILLVNLMHFKADAKAPEMMRFIFREAKLNDAMVFFDECEFIFESRENNPLLTSILAEFERYDGLVVLATNKAQVIDEAMNRRISLMVEFRLPDQQMREQIWRSHIPRNLNLHDDVCITLLALSYELSGGLIRNATLAAINHAVARERSATPTLRMLDFEEGARQQLRGFFLAAEKPPGGSIESYITPRRPLSDVVVEQQLRQQLCAVAQLAKGRSTLFSLWGFNEDECVDQGALYLFHGPSGTGKSLAAEGIAYECAAKIRLCNVTELMLLREPKVHEVFNEGRRLGAIIVFDEAQVLFNHSEQSIHMAKMIQYHAVRYPRPVIFIATTGTADFMSIDLRATPLVFQQEILFRLPTEELRRELWKCALPDKMPVADDIDLNELSKVPVSAKVIRAAVFSACCKVSMLSPNTRRLTMQMLYEELEDMRIREKNRLPLSSMFA